MIPPRSLAPPLLRSFPSATAAPRCPLVDRIDSSWAFTTTVRTHSRGGRRGDDGAAATDDPARQRRFHRRRVVVVVPHRRHRLAAPRPLAATTLGAHDHRGLTMVAGAARRGRRGDGGAAQEGMASRVASFSFCFFGVLLSREDGARALSVLTPRCLTIGTGTYFDG